MTPPSGKTMRTRRWGKFFGNLAVVAFDTGLVLWAGAPGWAALAFAFLQMSSLVAIDTALEVGRILVEQRR